MIKAKIKQFSRDRKGYIVNIYDSINFDIDFGFTEDEMSLFNIPGKQYTYIDSNDLNTIDPKFSEPRVGKFHKCRLNGLIKNQNYSSDRMIFSQVGLLVNESDGFIKYSIVDIDCYNRILVDLEFIMDNRKVNLRDFILENSKVYNQYCARRSIKLQPAGSISYSNYLKSISKK